MPRTEGDSRSQSLATLQSPAVAACLVLAMVLACNAAAFAASPHFGHRLGIGTGVDVGGNPGLGVRAPVVAGVDLLFIPQRHLELVQPIEFSIDTRPIYHVQSVAMSDLGVAGAGLFPTPIFDPHDEIFGEAGPHDVASYDAFSFLDIGGAATQATFYFHSTPTVAWVEDGGSPVAIARQGDLVPDAGAATFTTFGEVAIGPDFAVFSGYGSLGLSGIYSYRLSDGLLQRVADSTQARPRSAGNFEGPTGIDVDATHVIWSDAKGAYRAPLDGSAAPDQPAASGDLYSPGLGLGAAFSHAVFWGNRILFRAPNATFQDGIFAVDPANPAVIQRIVDGQTPVPGGTGNFSVVQNAAGGGDLVVFEGFNAAVQYLGLYAWRAGEIAPVLLKNQPLGQHTVFSAAVNKRGVLADGAGLLLAASYFDNTSQVVLALDCILISDFEEKDFSEWSSTSP